MEDQSAGSVVSFERITHYALVRCPMASLQLSSERSPFRFCIIALGEPARVQLVTGIW